MSSGRNKLLVTAIDKRGSVKEAGIPEAIKLLGWAREFRNKIASATLFNREVAASLSMTKELGAAIQ